MQPTSLNVATALEAALLHPDLTQDLTDVYTNPLPNAYPLSAYSYLVAPCSPASGRRPAHGVRGQPDRRPRLQPDRRPTSPFPPSKGQALGEFVGVPGLRAARRRWPTLGYSPLPPVLVQEDFDAIGRMNGGQEPPPVSAADCKNPYVDGEIPLPGSPVVQGLGGGGIGGTGGTTAPGSPPPPGPGGSSGGSGRFRVGSSRRSGGSSGSGSGSEAFTSADAAAGLTPKLAAEGYTVVNGQIVRKLGVGGPN